MILRRGIVVLGVLLFSLLIIGCETFSEDSVTNEIPSAEEELDYMDVDINNTQSNLDERGALAGQAIKKSAKRSSVKRSKSSVKRSTECESSVECSDAQVCRRKVIRTQAGEYQFSNDLKKYCLLPLNKNAPCSVERAEAGEQECGGTLVCRYERDSPGIHPTCQEGATEGTGCGISAQGGSSISSFQCAYGLTCRPEIVFEESLERPMAWKNPREMSCAEKVEDGSMCVKDHGCIGGICEKKQGQFSGICSGMPDKGEDCSDLPCDGGLTCRWRVSGLDEQQNQFAIDRGEPINQQQRTFAQSKFIEDEHKTCKEKIPNYGPCESRDQCQSGFCNTEKRCVDKETWEFGMRLQERTDLKKKCSEDEECPGRLICRKYYKEDNSGWSGASTQCLMPINTGGYCDSHGQCESGICNEDHRCVAEADCAINKECHGVLVCRRHLTLDLSRWNPSSTYLCLPPLEKGFLCEEEKNQCEEDLLCFDGKCRIAPIKQSRSTPNLCALASAEMAIKDLGNYRENQYTLGEKLCEKMHQLYTRNPNSNYPDCEWDQYPETFQNLLGDHFKEIGFQVEEVGTDYDTNTGLVSQARFDALIHHLRQGHTAIIHVRKHYMLAVDYDDASRFIYINDPARGKMLKVGYTDFQNRHSNWYREGANWDGRYLAIWK